MDLFTLYSTYIKFKLEIQIFDILMIYQWAYYGVVVTMFGYGVVVTIFDFHRSDRSSNPGRGGKMP